MVLDNYNEDTLVVVTDNAIHLYVKKTMNLNNLRYLLDQQTILKTSTIFGLQRFRVESTN